MGGGPRAVCQACSKLRVGNDLRARKAPVGRYTSLEVTDFFVPGNNGDDKDDAGNASAARQLGKMIEAKTKEIIVRSTQPGGILWKQRNGVTA